MHICTLWHEMRFDQIDFLNYDLDVPEFILIQDIYPSYDWTCIYTQVNIYDLNKSINYVFSS